MTAYVIHKGCAICFSPQLGGFWWEDTHYGAESDDVFPNVEAAKADIDRVFPEHGPATPDDIEAALAARKLEDQP